MIPVRLNNSNIFFLLPISEKSFSVVTLTPYGRLTLCFFARILNSLDDAETIVTSRPSN